MKTPHVKYHHVNIPGSDIVPIASYKQKNETAIDRQKHQKQ